MLYPDHYYNTLLVATPSIPISCTARDFEYVTVESAVTTELVPLRLAVRLWKAKPTYVKLITRLGTNGTKPRTPHPNSSLLLRLVPWRALLR